MLMRAFRLPALAVAVIMPYSSGHSWYEKLHPPHRPAFHRACAVSAFAGVSPLSSGPFHVRFSGKLLRIQSVVPGAFAASAGQDVRISLGRIFLLPGSAQKPLPPHAPDRTSPSESDIRPACFRYGTGNSRCAQDMPDMRRLDGNSLGYIKVFSAQRIRSKGNWTRRHRPAALFFFPLSPTATQPTEKQLLRRCLNAFARFRERASFCPPAHRPDDGRASPSLRDMRAAADGIISSSLSPSAALGRFTQHARIEPGRGEDLSAFVRGHTRFKADIVQTAVREPVSLFRTG